mmetsp:Transcript_20168/g.33180  ORF Transcript_20168/g.33180 Transcript_20168/m.33180 type:complete len:86 (+) Transcript_20168:3195-3452(+)
MVQEAPPAAPFNQTLTPYHYADALKTFAFLLASIPIGLFLALVIFVFSIIAQMYATAPQSGCYIFTLASTLHCLTRGSCWHNYHT